MPWPLLRLSLRARLYLFCAVLIALLLAPSYYTLQQLAELRDIAYDLQSRHSVALLQVGRVEVALSRLRSETREFIDAPGEGNAGRLAESLNEVRRAVARFEQGSYEVRADSTLALVEAIAAATAEVDSLALAGDERAAIDVYRTALPLFEEGHAALAGLAQAIQGQSTAAAVRAQNISQRTARTAAAANGLAAGLAVLLALLSVGAITNPLRRLRSSMAAVAGGRFSPPTDLPYGRPDEIGDLTRSFRSMAERLAELDRLKAEFVSIASHELKTPVNVIRGYAEMIEDGTYGDVEGPLADALGYIREQTDVLRERVDQLLAMSRFEAQGLDVRPEPVVLADFFDELERNFAGVAARKRVTFRVQPDPSVPDVASLDRTRVRDELLGNLIGNAFKFTPEGGSIYFRAWGEPGWLIFQIRDTGQGIPSAQLPYVFEKYYQAGRHAGKVGAGLGLAIAREIAEAHGGRISAESEEGVGSVFRVELPVLAQSASPDSPSHRVYGSDRETEDEVSPASGGGAIPSRPALRASERG